MLGRSFIAPVWQLPAPILPVSSQWTVIDVTLTIGSDKRPDVDSRGRCKRKILARHSDIDCLAGMGTSADSKSTNNGYAVLRERAVHDVA